jgi:Zn finger protein HypA/HybF involved in hydrogenase expression
MKIVKCPVCKKEHEIKDNVVISFCPVCLEIMEEVKDGKKPI